MRQNKKDIPIHSLEEKKLKKKLSKELIDSEEAQKRMIAKHKKLTAHIETKVVWIPDDQQKTHFIVPIHRDENEVIEKYRNYLKSR